MPCHDILFLIFPYVYHYFYTNFYKYISVLFCLQLSIFILFSYTHSSIKQYISFQLDIFFRFYSLITTIKPIIAELPILFVIIIRTHYRYQVSIYLYLSIYIYICKQYIFNNHDFIILHEYLISFCLLKILIYSISKYSI